jgi:hypothetical protein
MYNALTTNESGPYHKKVWKAKIPEKIKIFLWFILNNAILTKDNMVKRKWPGDPMCYFCQQDETTTHLLFQCSVAMDVWAIIAVCLDANNIPSSIDNCWLWCENGYHGVKNFTLLV